MTKKLNKGAKVTLIVLASIIAIWGIIALLPRPKNYPSDNTFLRGDKLPLLIAHGGGNMEFPDNTIEAFYNAYSVDSNAMMETDVSITKDNIVLLSHDTSLDRKTNISGKIKDLNYSDLMKNEVDFNYENPVVSDDDGTGNNLNGERARYKNGEGKYVLPTDVSYPAGVSARHQTKFLATTLEDLIRAFPTNKINVEIKQAGDVGLLALQKTIELLNKLEGEGIHALSNVVVASFHDEVYDKMVEIQKKEIPTLMYSPAINCVVKYVLLSYTLMDVFFTDGICVFQLPMEQMGVNLSSKFLVDKAHSHNIAVHYWTIDDKEDMRYLISIGADGIMSNYPHRLAEVYAEYNK